jgi:hypothetical protein
MFPQAPIAVILAMLTIINVDDVKKKKKQFRRKKKIEGLT